MLFEIATADHALLKAIQHSIGLYVPQMLWFLRRVCISARPWRSCASSCSLQVSSFLICRSPESSTLKMQNCTQNTYAMAARQRVFHQPIPAQYACYEVVYCGDDVCIHFSRRAHCGTSPSGAVRALSGAGTCSPTVPPSQETIAHVASYHRILWYKSLAL